MATTYSKGSSPTSEKQTAATGAAAATAGGAAYTGATAGGTVTLAPVSSAGTAAVTETTVAVQTSAATTGAAAAPGVASYGLYPAIAVAGAITLGALMGVLAFVLGPFRLAAIPTLTIDGLPGVKQLSGIGAFKLLLNNAYHGALKGLGFLGKLVNSVTGKKATPQELNTGINKTISNAAIITNSTSTYNRINPFKDTLTQDMGALRVFSTANSDVSYWSGFTATSAVGALWWGIQQDFASTATGSYQSIFYTAKYHTDALCGTTGDSGIMSIDDIIRSNQSLSSNDPNVRSFVSSIPNLDTFAGTLFYPNYITSATNALNQLINDSFTSTTTLSQLTADRDQLNLTTQNLLTRIETDLANQSNWIQQTTKTSQLNSVASMLNQLRDSQPVYISSLYESTIHPDIRETVNGIAALENLNSANTTTALNGAQTLVDIGARVILASTTTDYTTIKPTIAYSTATVVGWSNKKP